MSSPVEYAFVKGSHMKGDAQAVGESLQSIRDSKGALTAPDVVEEAEPDESVLHPYFEWDDPTAAKEYRYEQARKVVRSVVVARTPQVRAFFNVVVNGSPSYEPVDRVMEVPDLRTQVLNEVSADLASVKRKLDGVTYFIDLVQGVAELQRKVQEKLIH